MTGTEYQDYDPIDILLQRTSWKKLKKLGVKPFLYSIGERLKLADQKYDETSSKMKIESFVDQESLRVTPTDAGKNNSGEDSISEDDDEDEGNSRQRKV
jgi:hypothetical protein